LVGHLFAVQRVGQLNQDTCAVAHERVSTHSTTVVEVFQNFERLTHDGVALLTLDVSDKAHATGVVFVGWVVQTLSLQLCLIGSRGHRAFLKKSAGREEYCIAACLPRKLIGVRTQLTTYQFCQLINWGQV
jgi:hypothetical protein